MQTYAIDEYISRGHPAHRGFAAEALSCQDFQGLAAEFSQREVTVFSTPFDFRSADFLEEIGAPLFKIASGDVTYVPFLQHIAKKGKPILLSTGACSWSELDAAVEAIRQESTAELVLLHCTAAYPAPDQDLHLNLIPVLGERYGLPVGFSDHSLGTDIALAGLALGAQVVGKHFTTNQSLDAGDNDMSILPAELKCLIKGGRRIALAKGGTTRQVFPSEEEVSVFVHRSMVVRSDMLAGDVLSLSDLAAVRPSGGIPPSDQDAIVGKRLIRDVQLGSYCDQKT